jgi:hypothetical protein
MESFKRLVFLVLCVYSLCSHVLAQTTFYKLDSLQKIELFFSQPNWDHQLDTAKYGADSYIVADSVRINGTIFLTPGVKYKGNSSYDSTYTKNPIHIALDQNAAQNYQGFTDVKLGNNYADPSMIREVLAYSILGNYMDCPRSNFAQLYINGNYVGLYSNEENINKKFFGDHFYSSSGTEIKCNPIVNPGPTTKCSLRHLTGVDSTGYFNYYEVKSKYGWNELVELCDTVTNFPSSLGNNVDMDRAIWMLAFDNVLVNLDSYMGVFCQNYYLYKDGTSRFNPIVWDLNMCFGGFPYAGSGNTSMGTLTIANMQQMSYAIHSTDQYWPLIKNMLADPMYKRMYVAHMRTITNEFFASNAYQSLAAQMQTKIDTAVFSDQNKFYSYADFQNGMTSNVSVGSYSVAGISNLMGPRVTYLQSTPEFTYSTPAISNITVSNAAPAYNSTVAITAQVTNVNTVYFGYRFSNQQKFTRILMYDDGAHNDGAASDNVFGTTLTMSAGQTEYYLYAENANAGIFSPERAEHEFYILRAQSYTPASGELVINELLADNITQEKDEYGEREDWVELYNNSNKLLDLTGLYLSDDITRTQKWQITDTTTLAPGDFMIVWTDNDSLQKVYHTNFNLSKTADILILSNQSGTVLDSISFFNQVSDISFGRYPNGTGPFVSMQTTFDASNSEGIGVMQAAAPIKWTIYPNPANGLVTITTEKPMQIEVRNILGELVVTENTSSKTELNVASWPEGIYLIKSGNSTQKVIVQH